MKIKYTTKPLEVSPWGVKFGTKFEYNNETWERTEDSWTNRLTRITASSSLQRIDENYTSGKYDKHK